MQRACDGSGQKADEAGAEGEGAMCRPRLQGWGRAGSLRL